MELEKKSDWKSRGGDISEHLPTGVFYVRKSFVRLGIKNLFQSTGETKLYRAKAKAPEIIKRHIDRYLHKVRTVGEVIEEFLLVETEDPNKRRSRTKENHRNYFRQLKAEWGETPITEIDEVSWVMWLRGFQKRKIRTTYNDYAVYMNMLMGYAYRRKYITHQVKLPFSDQKKQTGRVLPPEDVERLFHAMNENTQDQFLLAYECCMRLREGLHLTWDRVDLSTGFITLRKEDVKTGSRTGKGRVFMATEAALQRLRRRKAEQEAQRLDTDYVFPAKGNPRRPQNENKAAWNLAKQKAKVRGRCRWHDLRHTALSHLLLIHNANITKVSEYAGVSVRTLQRVYLHSTAEQTKEVAVLQVGLRKV
jgi:integrase